jgi:hypothetical protein
LPRAIELRDDTRSEVQHLLIDVRAEVVLTAVVGHDDVATRPNTQPALVLLGLTVREHLDEARAQRRVPAFAHTERCRPVVAELERPELP